MRVITMLAFIGCNSEKADEVSYIDNPNSDDTCQGEAPIIDSLICENPGILNSPDHGEVPAIVLELHATDTDGDLNSYTAEIFFDTDIDGEIGADATVLVAPPKLISAEECSIDDATIDFTIYLRGGEPDYETEYEWHVVLIDSSGDMSEPYATVCTTPTAEGEDVQ